MSIVHDLESVLDTLKNEKGQLSDYGVEMIGIFGSCARGEATDDSDLDILVVFKEGQKTFRHFMGLREFLQSIFGERVDLVTLQSIDPKLRDSIENDIVYEKVS
jgi:predicted nucleotidyltransferase